MYTFNRVLGNIHQSEMLYRDDTRGGKSTRGTKGVKATRGTRGTKATRGTRGAKTPTTRGAKNPRGRGAESARGTWDSSYIPAFSDISSTVSNNSSGTNNPPASCGSSTEFHLDFR
ncbi:hypothetical protein LSTR_LSTR001459 [Laodelphax striatellus]|nr:hypothetical protein LSTR_LSTR001459 [Laodelphax striatellus]